MITKRFYLKKLTPKYASKNYLKWFQDDDVKKFILSSKNQKNLNSLKKYIDYNNSKKNTLLLGIFNKSKRHICNIKFDKIDQKNNSVIMGILIGDKTYRDKGAAGEIINFFSEYFYNKYKITNIFLGVNIKNKIGYTAIIKKYFKKRKIKIYHQKFFPFTWIVMSCRN